MQIDRAAAERAKLRRWRTSQGWDDEQVENAVHTLKEKQHAKEEEEFSSNKHLCEMGGLDYYFTRYVLGVGVLAHVHASLKRLIPTASLPGLLNK